jgi:hypothetical protein
VVRSILQHLPACGVPCKRLEALERHGIVCELLLHAAHRLGPNALLQVIVHILSCPIGSSDADFQTARPNLATS